MAEDLPDAPWVKAEGNDLPDAPWASKPAAKGYFGNLSDIVSGAVSDIGESRKQTQGHPSSVLTDWAREGADVAAIAGAPFTAAYKTAAPYIAGPMASGIQTVGEPIAKALNPKAELPTHEQITEAITPDVERALGTFGARGVPAPMTIPAPRPVGPLGVTLTEGQATRNLPLIQREQAAVRGQSGPPAEARAQQFVAQQRAETQAAREDVGRSFDPSLQQVAQTPHDAGDIISQGLQQEAAARRAEYGHLYETARSTPGEIHANIFNNMGDAVRTDLASAAGPTIDDALSPFASRALRDLDNGPAIMEGIRGMQPSPHFSLADADLLRKRLSLYRRGATNAYDRTATQSVIDAFDDRIDRAVNSGAFNGDPRAVQAWNDARAAYADYRRTFTGGRNDPVGRVVEKIIGRDAVGNLAAGPATPNEVADFLSGGIGVNAKGVQVGVSNRIRQIFGGNSPQWSAVKQGLWSRVLERPQGVTEWGPRQQANRLNEFLNGKGRDLAESVYAPPERDLMRAYADLMDRVAVPQAGANWSNSATFVQRALDKIGSTVGTLVGSAIGHYMGLPLGAAEAAGYAVTKGTQAIGRYSEMRRIARQMPLVGQQIGRWQRAVNRSAAAGILAPATATNAARAADGLSKALARLGVAAASQDNKKEREPRGQQKGGRINAQQQRFADGGAPEYDPLAASAHRAAGGAAPGLRDGEVHPVDTTPEDEPLIESDTSKPEVDLEKPVRKAHGGRVDEGKATKAEAEYKTKGNPPRICQNCQMFREPSSCTAVKGQISPQAVCKFFEAKKGRASGGRIDASHTVRTGANSSVNGTVYVDPRIPAKFRKFLAVHETTEQKHMAGGYARAHKIATAAERKAVEASGMDWRHYTAEMDGYLDHIEHEKDTNPPKGKLHVSAGVALGHHRSGNKS